MTPRDGATPTVNPASGSTVEGRDEIETRKQDHLALCDRDDVEADQRTTLLEEVELIHDAVPDLALEDIDCGVTWLGKRLRAPLVITSMTGGTEEAYAINRNLAELAEACGIAFGVGSQRAMQKHPETEWTFRVREFAPTTVLLANIGLAQARQMSLDDFRRLIEPIAADALCVHLNVAQELTQPEGDRDFRGGTALFARLTRELPVPVVAKETGCGISGPLARRLFSVGVRHLDVSGAGGTSWVRIEALRAPGGSVVGELFRDWGVPTAASLLQTRGLDMTRIASGGIRTGLDMARALALGASLAGVALPVYQAYRRGGVGAAKAWLEEQIAVLKVAMLLCGAATVRDLQHKPLVLGPRLARWAPQAIFEASRDGGAEDGKK